MKKLMIAAAAVAMIGAAQATNIAYDFSSTVKTTTGKNAKQTANVTLNLGYDDVDGFWWENAGPMNAKKTGFKAAETPFADDKAAKAYIATLKTDADKAAYAEILNDKLPAAWSFDGTVANWGEKTTFKKKLQWCTTFKFKVTNEDCYRTPVSRSWKAVLVAWNDCCANQWSIYENINDAIADINSVDINNKMLNAINGLTLDKANKVEYMGVFESGLLKKWGQIADVFTMAGQGDFAALGKAKIGGAQVDLGKDVKTISGNIVGAFTAPTCEECCDYGAYALYFQCGPTMYDADIRAAGEDNCPTAAFGTFTIKYNKANTEKVN